MVLEAAIKVTVGKSVLFSLTVEAVKFARWISKKHAY